MSRPIQLALLFLAPLALFAAMVAADRLFGAPGRGYDYVLRLELPPAGGEVGLPPVRGPLDASRPLVVLDPGHGGHDPGAGSARIREKDLTLQLAAALRDELLKGGGVRVAMTREDDRYLMLDERSDIARRLRADLFVSIHADSVEDPSSSHASGASVYILSERGSSQAAARIAARENRADRINGVEIGDTSDSVTAILVDLSQRDTLARSDELARILLREMGARLKLRDDTVQSAAFVVLKSPDLPSVLVETGYVSNPADAALLASPDGRAAFATSAARAIRVYLARRSGT